MSRSFPTFGPPSVPKRLNLTVPGRGRVLFIHAPALLDSPVAAQVANTLDRQLQLLRGQEVLVIDELGYTRQAEPIRYGEVCY
jgi:DNA replication protein DnaC